MSSKLLHVRKAIFSTLTASTTLMAMVKGVYDDLPDNTLFPYIVFEGETENRHDLMSSFGKDITLTLCIWSQYKGMAEAEAILSVVNGLLDYQTLTSTGISYWEMCRYEGSNKLDMNDGFTRGLSATYRCYVW